MIIITRGPYWHNDGKLGRHVDKIPAGPSPEKSSGIKKKKETRCQEIWREAEKMKVEKKERKPSEYEREKRMPGICNS